MASKLKTVADKAPSEVSTLTMSISNTDKDGKQFVRAEKVIGSFDKAALGADFDLHVQAAKVAALNEARREGRDTSEISFTLAANEE